MFSVSAHGSGPQWSLFMTMSPFSVGVSPHSDPGNLDNGKSSECGINRGSWENGTVDFGKVTFIPTSPPVLLKYRNAVMSQVICQKL